jgi:hypothetical protein
MPEDGGDVHVDADGIIIRQVSGHLLEKRQAERGYCVPRQRQSTGEAGIHHELQVQPTLARKMEGNVDARL